MPYSQFKTIGKVKESFDITTIEGAHFLLELEPLFPSNTIRDYLKESLPLAVATGNEKARAELIVSPILVEIRRILK